MQDFIPYLAQHGVVKLEEAELDTVFGCRSLYFRTRRHAFLPVLLLQTMQDFIREGKVRYFAVSNWSADRQKAADAYCREKGYRGIVADQALLNLGSKYMNPLDDDTLVYVKGDLYDYHKENLNNLMMPYMGNASGFFDSRPSNGISPIPGKNSLSPLK